MNALLTRLGNVLFALALSANLGLVLCFLVALLWDLCGLRHSAGLTLGWMVCALTMIAGVFVGVRPERS